MFLLGDDRRLVISASDLRTAAACEFALVRELDVAARPRRAGVVEDDPMAARVIALGNEHEQAELRRLAAGAPGSRSCSSSGPATRPDDLARAHAQTLDALTSDAEVVYQATFFDGGFVGHADFLERTPDGWLVSDTKLARTESVPALLQIAAYAALLRDAGVPTAPVARLVVGSGDVARLRPRRHRCPSTSRDAPASTRCSLAAPRRRRAGGLGRPAAGSPAGGARSASPRSRPPATSSSWPACAVRPADG